MPITALLRAYTAAIYVQCAHYVRNTGPVAAMPCYTLYLRLSIRKTYRLSLFTIKIPTAHPILAVISDLFLGNYILACVIN